MTVSQSVFRLAFEDFRKRST